MADIIAVANQAGGARKTTTALGLSGAFADRGDDTLLIDLDPQGVATEEPSAESGRGEWRLTSSEGVVAAAGVDRSGADRRIVRATIEHHDEFDLIPANMAMKGLKDKLQTVANARCG